MGVALQRLAKEDPSFRVHTDPGIRPDDHLRHGRAAPRDHRRPHEARVQGRGQRRQAAGRLPRDDPRHRRVRRQVRASSRAAAASTATSGSSSSRTRRARATSSSTASSAAPCRASSSRPIEKGVKEAVETGVMAGYPVVDVKVTAVRRLVPRRRLDEMAFRIAALDRLQGRLPQGEAGDPRADHEGRGRDARGLHGRRHRRPESPPRPDHRHGRHARGQVDHSPKCRWRRCSATRPSCAR